MENKTTKIKTMKTQCKEIKGTGIVNKCSMLLEKTLVYYPSNSKKGIAIKGTNLRVGFEYK